MRRNFWGSSALICAPSVVVIAFAAVFYHTTLPDLVEMEANRVRTEYREIALELKEHPEQATLLERGRGADWAPEGRMAPGRWGMHPAVIDGYQLVWYQPDSDSPDILAATVETVPERNFFLYCTLGGLGIVLLVVGMSIVGMRYLIVYGRSRDDFMAATAHDLITPLVGLRGMIGRNDEEARHLTERLLRLVQNVQDFLKLGGRRKAPDCQPFDLRKAYAVAYQSFQEDFRDWFNGADVAVECPNDLPLAYGDELLTVQILWNLLGNSLKYAAPFGPVKVVFSVEGKFLTVSCIDEGQGMTKRERRHAFDRYYRAKTILKSGKGGFGIGLCTSREFAREMGGDLTVRANTPKGCIFTLSLPIQRD